MFFNFLHSVPYEKLLVSYSNGQSTLNGLVNKVNPVLDQKGAQTPDAMILDSSNVASSCSIESLVKTILLNPNLKTEFPIAYKYLETDELFKKYLRHKNVLANHPSAKMNFSFIPAGADADRRTIDGRFLSLIAARYFMSLLNNIDNLSTVQSLINPQCAMFMKPWNSFDTVEDLEAFYKQVTMTRSGGMGLFNRLLYDNCTITADNQIIRCSWLQFNPVGSQVFGFGVMGVLSGVLTSMAILRAMKNKKIDNAKKGGGSGGPGQTGRFTYGVGHLPITKKGGFHPLDPRAISIKDIGSSKTEDYNPFNDKVDWSAPWSYSQILELSKFSEPSSSDKNLIFAQTIDSIVISDNASASLQPTTSLLGLGKSLTRSGTLINKITWKSAFSKILAKAAPRSALALVGLGLPVVNLLSAGLLVYDFYEASKDITNK